MSRERVSCTDRVSSYGRLRKLFKVSIRKLIFLTGLSEYSLNGNVMICYRGMCIEQFLLIVKNRLSKVDWNDS